MTRRQRSSHRVWLRRLRQLVTLLLVIGAFASAAATLAGRMPELLGGAVASLLTALAAATSQLQKLPELLSASDATAGDDAGDVPTGDGTAAGERTKRARRALLDEVRRHWVEAELEGSLHHLARLELGLSARPHAVESPLRAILRRPDEPDQPLPRGTPIIDVFRMLGRQLLILGEPGAGKTTLLLELTQQLLTEVADAPSEPAPVVFHLSTWAITRGPLSAWLVDELDKRYGVTRRLAQRWIDTDQVVPLLDGLDEVAPEHRSACLAAINEFHDEHGQLAIVVASRVSEYEALQSRLHLRGAVVIEPLTRPQVDRYLIEAGEQLEGVRAVLRDDEQLYGLMTTPLLLSIVALTYRGRSGPTMADGSIDERREQVLDDYVSAMLRRPSASTGQYTDESTVSWLVWLARAMRAHGQSVFYPDLLQPDWLPSRVQRWLVTVGPAVAVGAACALVGGLLVRFSEGPDAGITFGMGVSVGVALAAYEQSIVLTEQLRWSWNALRLELPSWLVLGLVIGLAGGVSYGVASGAFGELTLLFIDPNQMIGGFGDAVASSGSSFGIGIGIGLGIGLIGGASRGLETRLYVTPPAPGRGIRRSRRNGLVGGLVAGLASGAIVVLLPGPLIALYGETISLGFRTGFSRAVVSALYSGIFLGMGGGLIAALTVRDVSRLGATVRRALIAALVGGLVIGLLQQGIGQLDSSRSIRLDTTPVLGLCFGLIVALTGAIRGAWRTRLLAGAGGGLIVGLVGGLVFDLRSRTTTTILPTISGSSPRVLVVALAVGLAAGVAVALQRGGGAYLRHHAVRALLTRNGTVPRDYLGFLEYAARLVLLRRRGGGYQFVHRFLLEHFARMQTAPPVSDPVLPRPRQPASATVRRRAEGGTLGALLIGLAGVSLLLLTAVLAVGRIVPSRMNERLTTLLALCAVYLLLAPFGVILSIAALRRTAHRGTKPRGRLLTRIGLGLDAATAVPIGLLLLGILRPPLTAPLAATSQLSLHEHSTLSAVAVAPDGSVYLAEGGFIGRLHPSGHMSWTANVSPGTDVDSLAQGPDGSLWFIEPGKGIGRLTPSGGVTRFAITTGPADLAGIATRPDGSVWFAERGVNQIGHITPDGKVAELPVPTASSLPTSVAGSSDGSVWFTEAGANQVGRIMPSGAVTEFPVTTQASRPASISCSPDGTAWFIESSARQIGAISPSGAVREFPVSADLGGIATSRDGSAWFTEPGESRIGRITPSGQLSQFPINGQAGPTGIAAAVDGAFWFSEYTTNSLARITPSGEITEFKIAERTGQPRSMAPARDGDVWFTEPDSDRIGKVTGSGQIEEFATPTQSAQLWGIAPGPDGALWFTESAANQIGRVTATGTLTEFRLPTASSQPWGITAGPDGNMWFTEAAGRIGHITPSGEITELVIPSANGADEITAGPDGALWFTESSANRIGRMTVAGSVREYAVPTAGSSPTGIATGPDGALWFTETDANRIGRITPSGEIHEFLVNSVLGFAGAGLDVLTNVRPQGIASGPDGALWFTEGRAGRVGRITPSGAVTEFRVPAVTGLDGLAFDRDRHLWVTAPNESAIVRVAPRR